MGCRIPASCRIYGTPQCSRMEGIAVFGERVSLNSLPYFARLGQSLPCVFSTGKHGVIEIGDDTVINGAAIFAERRVAIGRRVMIGSDTKITDIDCHPIDVVPRRYASSTEPPRPIIIDDDVWIGMNCIVLPGVHIGHGSVIGAGSIVTRDVPSMSIAAGCPAKVIRPLGCSS